MTKIKKVLITAFASSENMGSIILAINP